MVCVLIRWFERFFGGGDDFLRSLGTHDIRANKPTKKDVLFYRMGIDLADVYYITE